MVRQKGEAVNDLIRRADVIELVDWFEHEYDEIWQYLQSFLRELNHLPSAQPERKKGKWVFSPDHAEGICTCCNYKIYGRPYQNTYLIVSYNYCPNCGAEMEK